MCAANNEHSVAGRVKMGRTIGFRNTKMNLKHILSERGKIPIVKWLVTQ